MISFSGKRETYSTLSKNQANILKILRLVLLAVILLYYFKPTSIMIESFFNATIARAKNNFLFVQPVEINGQSDVSDFATFYAAGLLNKERFTKYHDLDIYDPYLLTQSVERLFAPMQPAEVYSIQYPPTFFALMTSLAFFDLSTAWYIWAFISALCVVIAFVCIAYDRIIKRPLILIGLLIFLTCSPVVVNYTFGQMTILQAALLAITLRLLLEKRYFLAGLAGAAAFFKLQQALIALIPGFCLGRKKFFYGFFVMAILEILLSAYVVGYNNIFNFIRANYLCEIAHAYVGLNETWAMFSFRGLLAALFNNLANADRIAFIAYALVCIGSVLLWIKVYPALKKTSPHAFALIASLSTCALVYFSLHNYFYDYLLMFIPAIWLYIWSSSNDEAYTVRESVFRLLVSLISFALPFLFLTGLDLGEANTNVGYELKLFFGNLVFLICAAEAIIIEYEKGRQIGAKI